MYLFFKLNKTSYFVLISVLSMLLFSVASSPVSALNSVNILPPGGKPYGLTYAQQQMKYWKWQIGIPAKDNPLNDPTGEKCAAGQLNSSSPLFYLSFNNGGISQRTCKVPVGKALFIPVMQVEWSQKEAPKDTAQDLIKAATTDQDSVNSLYLKIGDKEWKYQDLLKYRTHTGIFNVTFPDNGLFGILHGGPTITAGDGFYIMTEPLAKGTYPVHFKSSLICTQPDCVDPNFAQDITYTIIAQ
jgi:hypothetical protein